MKVFSGPALGRVAPDPEDGLGEIWAIDAVPGLDEAVGCAVGLGVFCWVTTIGLASVPPKLLSQLVTGLRNK